MEKLSNELIRRNRDVEENLKIIKERIDKAAYSAGRDSKEIVLLAATKTVPVEVINHSIFLGIDTIGENKVQELLSKYNGLNKKDCSTHLIGHLQTNKVKKVVGKVDMIQSVDSERLALEIARVSKKQDVKTDILIEVNIGKEKNKSGALPENLEELFYIISQIDGIRVRGLMAIPPICQKKSETRKYFSHMYKLFIDIRDKKLDNINMDVLSMGMSADYEEAILEGATMIRVGSALFGKRD